MDFVADVPIPDRIREPLRDVLRGAGRAFPQDLTDAETHALIAHGVAPLLYAATGAPSLRAEAIRAAALEALRTAEVREVLAAFAERGVETLILKGTALAHQVYASPELRPRSDTDLLIRPSDLPVVREVLSGLGFAERPSSGDEHALRQTAFERNAAHSWDVHWSIINTPVFQALPGFDELETRAVSLPTLTARARGLGRVDALLLACAHRVAHHHDSDRLIWLVDIALLRDRMTRDEHGRFWRLAAETGIVAVCARSIALADEWNGREPHDGPEQWLTADELARPEASRVFLDRHITHGGILFATMRALPWRARLTRLWQLAFPPAEFMRSSFGARSAMALPWLYVYRGARGVARLFRRIR